MAKGRTRANGDGSMRVRGKSVEFRIAGKSFTERVDGRSKAELRTRLSELAGAPQRMDGRISLSEYADSWYTLLYKRVEAGKMEESTYVSYQYTLKIIKDAWGHIPLNELSAADIDNGFDALTTKDGKPYSMSAQKKVKAMLGQILKLAVKEKKISRNDNPMLDVETLAGTNLLEQAAEKDAYSEDDLPKLLEDLPNNKYGHAIRVCLATGLRGQEILPLRVEDIEPDGSAFVVNKAMKRGETKYTGKPKSDAGHRFVEVPGYAQKSVLWLVRHAKNGYILPNKTGSYISYSTYLGGYNSAISKVDVKRLPPHCTRHTFTTDYKIRMGVDDALTMAATGHSDRKTMEGYAHTQRKDLRALADQHNDYVQSLLKKD